MNIRLKDCRLFLAILMIIFLPQVSPRAEQNQKPLNTDAVSEDLNTSYSQSSIFNLQSSIPETLSLKECIELTLKNNPIIRSMEKATIAADYSRKSRKTDFLPSLSLSGNYTVLDQAPTIEISSSEIFPGTESISMKVSDKEMYSVGIQLQQPLFTSGALRNYYKKSTLEVDAAKIAERKTTQELILGVHQAYYGVLMAYKLHEVSLQAIKTLEAHVEAARNFYESGVVPKNDLLKAEVQLADIRHNAIKAENGVEIARIALNNLLGLDTDARFELSDSLKYEPFDQTLEACLEAAYAHRPDLQELNTNRKIACTALKIVRSQYYPMLAVVGNYSWNKEELSWEVDEVKSITAAISCNLWNWGKTHYQAAEVNYQIQRLDEIIAQLKSTIAMEVKASFLKLNEAQKGIGVTEKAIAQAEENLRMSEDRYRQAVTTSTEVLDAETQLIQTRTNYYSSLYDYNLARANLLKYMGVIK